MRCVRPAGDRAVYAPGGGGRRNPAKGALRSPASARRRPLLLELLLTVQVAVSVAATTSSTFAASTRLR